MLTFEELKEKIESFPMHVEDQSIKNDVKIVAKQIGYSVPDCRCQDKFNDLVVKLKLWLRQHPEPCHYTIRPGIVRRGPDGNNIYNLNLTDETAEWLLANDPEGAKWITKIVSDEAEETSNTINQNETESVSENVSAENEPKTKSKRKTKK